MARDLCGGFPLTHMVWWLQGMFLEFPHNSNSRNGRGEGDIPMSRLENPTLERSRE